HPGSAVVGGGGRRQEEGAAELHQSPADPDPVWRRPAHRGGAGGAHPTPGLRAAPGAARDVRPGTVLSLKPPPSRGGAKVAYPPRPFTSPIILSNTQLSRPENTATPVARIVPCS